MNEHYPFELLPLPYDYNELEPYIDKETMKIHHDKHLGTYVENLNKVLSNYPQYYNWSIEKILHNISSLPLEIQTPVKNNAGGVFNHNLYFSSLSNKIENIDEMKFIKSVNSQFGSFDIFLKQLMESALSVFGSGYANVVLNRNGNIMIIKKQNQDTPLESNLYPLFLIDVWEHAYYLKHKNKREEYIKDLFKIINWKSIEQRYNDYLYIYHKVF